MLKWLLNRWREPDTKVAILGIIAAAGSYFGLDLTLEQQLAIFAFIGSAIGVVTASMKRGGSPDAEPPKPEV